MPTSRLRFADATTKLTRRGSFPLRMIRIPRKRCYPLSLAKHRKILRPLRGDAPRSCLASKNKIIRNEKQTISKQFQAGSVENFPAFLAASRSHARAEHDPL